MTAERFAAPAKLNLMLRVVGRRADGYHLLQTVLRFIDHGDEVSLAVREDGEIRRVTELPGVAAEDDLTMRAARLLKSASGTRVGADIGVLKRLPMGAGLGGGSSDAATVLLALNRLWGTGLRRAQLQALAVELGADVPVFIFGESAVGEGIGEILTPLALPPAWYLVLTPKVSVATVAVFSHPELKRDSKMIKIQGFSVEASTHQRPRQDRLCGPGWSPEAPGVNDLQPLVCRLYPEVERHLAWLVRECGEQCSPLMTGSGAAVFACFDSEKAALDVRARLPSGMGGFVARGLDRHPLWALGE